MLKMSVTVIVAVAVLVVSACGAGEGPSSNQQGTSAATSVTGGTAAPAAPPAASPMPMDVPSGTELLLTLETPVSLATANAEQPVRAKMAKAVVVAGMTVIPEGAPVTGTVVAERSGRDKGRASMALQFDEVSVLNTPYKISTAPIAQESEKMGFDAGVTLSTTMQETVRIMAPM
jgi:hypothetical protein